MNNLPLINNKQWLCCDIPTASSLLNIEYLFYTIKATTIHGHIIEGDVEGILITWNDDPFNLNDKKDTYILKKSK